jgi:hypothetical protein
MILLAQRHGRKIYAQHDQTADVWELFFDTDGEGYAGYADSLGEAREMAKWVLDDIDCR